MQNSFAMNARKIDSISVNTTGVNILSFKSFDNSNFGEIIPICKLVESLEANDPKIFPLIPMVPGMITSNPGNAFKRKVMFPNIIPANKSPIAQIINAMKLSFKT